MATIDKTTWQTFLYLCKLVNEDAKPERMKRKAERAKKYRERNAEKIAVYRKRYREKHKDVIHKQKKRYKAKNKDVVKKYQNNYRENNKEKYNAYNRKWRAKLSEEKKQRKQDIDNFSLD